MTLRMRLALAFVGVMLVPLIVAALLVQTTVPKTAREQRGERLTNAAASVSQRLLDLCERAVALARATALDASGRTPGDAVSATVKQGGASYAQVADSAGHVLAHAGSDVLTSTSECSAESNGQVGIQGTAEVQSTAPPARLLRATVGFVLDGVRLSALRPTADVDLALVGPDNHVLASTRKAQRTAQLKVDVDGDVHRSGGRLVSAEKAGSKIPWTVVTSTDDASGGSLPWILLTALIVATCGAWLLGRRLALLTTAPLAEVADVATRIAEGDLAARAPEEGGDEVASLGAAFNDMTERLQSTITQLQANRDQMRRDLRRLGETLSSTHDLTRILGVILDTAVDTLRADAGAVYLTTTSGDDLYLKVGRELEGRGATSSGHLAIGSGVIGAVALSGDPACGQVGVDVHPSADEPTASDLIAVPLRSSGRVIGVLAVYDRQTGPFASTDLETLLTFAGQASVAVENVLLHQEAQRLSVTDGLTGVSNYRAFQRQLAREVERAHRFERPLGLLLLDIDHFKEVNDTYGHQVGDQVLIELARRVQAEVRDVDFVARYGGEELVVVLPETDIEGGGLLAERICESVRAMPFDASTTPLTVTVSVGVASLPVHGTNPAELIRAADEAMYASKAAGRDTWRVAGQDPVD